MNPANVRTSAIFDDPESLPLLPATATASLGPTLIIAPHPDDETLGCGGLIATLRQQSLDVWVMVVSDGTGSHRGSRRYPPDKLRDLRQDETRNALSVLGVPSEALSFINLPDEAVPDEDSAAFADAVDRMRANIAQLPVRPETVILPWRRDPHRDHRATWQLARAALVGTEPAPRLLEYPIWIWDLHRPNDTTLLYDIDAWRLDISHVLHQKRDAIAQHRSQTTDLISDDPDGFRLPDRTLARFTQPWELFIEVHPVSDKVTLSQSFFEYMYDKRPDPWSLESRPYEAAKYAATTATLPRPHYHSGLEIGCSIGVLTAQLAERCDALLAVDIIDDALERARERCRDYQHVRFEQMLVPDKFPNAQFDLIVLSEVGYYWSWTDLHRAKALLIRHLDPGGQLLLVHWRPDVDEHPLTGDQVHDEFMRDTTGELLHIAGRQEHLYRIDVFERRD